MPEGKSDFLKKIIGPGDEVESPKGYTSERQHTAQAFGLHVERRDRKRSEGFAWSHYGGYQWTDEGSQERLVVLFSERAVEIEGHHLDVLVREIQDGQLNGIYELLTAESMQLKADNPGRLPVIASVTCYPDFEEILMEIKGDKRNGQKHTQRLDRRPATGSQGLD